MLRKTIQLSCYWLGTFNASLIECVKNRWQLSFLPNNRMLGHKYWTYLNINDFILGWSRLECDQIGLVMIWFHTPHIIRWFAMIIIESQSNLRTIFSIIKWANSVQLSHGLDSRYTIWPKVGTPDQHTYMCLCSFSFKSRHWC